VQGLSTIVILWEMIIDTNSVKQSPSWEAKISTLSQEIPGILKNPIVHYRVFRADFYVLSQGVCFKVRGSG